VTKDRRQQHHHEDRENVFNDQPPDPDMAGRGMEVAIVGENPH
jgi:hypothetical protein